MNFSFPSLYKEIEHRYMNDKEFTDVIHILTENVYREEILTLFGKETFEDSINEDILSLYNKVKENENIKTLVDILKKKYNDDLIAFTVLFSYDHFYLCFREIITQKKTIHWNNDKTPRPFITFFITQI